MILKNKELSSRQNKLIEYILRNGFELTDSKDLGHHISGMTVDDIIKSIETAAKIKDDLCSSPLGKELL